MSPCTFSFVSALAIAAVLCVSAPAQTACTPDWTAGGYPGIKPASGGFLCEAWDPDGAGPASPMLVASLNAGSIVGPLLSSPVMGYDMSTRTWAPLPVSGVVVGHAANGDLFFASGPVVIGGVTTQNLVRWDGANLFAYGAGPRALVEKAVEASNGDVYGVIYFLNTDASVITRWNGTAWSDLPGSITGRVTALVPDANGGVYACGNTGFNPVAGANGVAYFNGVGWQALGNGVLRQSPAPFAALQGLVLMPNGHVLVGGTFNNAAGGHETLAEWDGTSWTNLPGHNGAIWAMALLPNGEVLIGGLFGTAGGVSAPGVSIWNGTAHRGIGEGTNFRVFDLVTFPNGEFVVHGDLTRAGGQPAMLVARSDGQSWAPLTGGASDPINALAVLPNGDVVAGGRFERIGDVVTPRVARFDGSQWTAMGSGLPDTVNCLAASPNGEIYAGGSFTTGPLWVARWTGSSWQTLGNTFLVGSPLAMTVLSNADLVIAGNTGVSRWDGTAWSPVAPGTPCRAIAAMPDGGFVVVGEFTSIRGVAANRIATFRGGVWSPLGNGLTGLVAAVAVMPNGDIVAGGSQVLGTDAVARWNGSSWVPMGNAPASQVKALAVLADGSLVAGGSFTTAGAVPANAIARWNGTAWSQIGGGLILTNTQNQNPSVNAIVAWPDGRFAAGGDFIRAGTVGSAYFALHQTPCPATAANYGTGCSGAVGPIQLVADRAPWLGGVFSSTASSCAPGSLAFWIVGFQQTTIPLSSAHPLGGSGCSLLASLDSVRFVIPVAGTAAGSLAIPSSTALIGAQFFNQVAVAELDPSLTITGIFSSDAVTATIGRL